MRWLRSTEGGASGELDPGLGWNLRPAGVNGCGRVIAHAPTDLPSTASRFAAAAGQGIIEYGLILSLSAVLAVVLLVVFGGTLSALLQVVGDAIDAAT